MDITEKPSVIFNTSTDRTITGLGVHIDLGLVFACDSKGFLFQLHLPSKSQRIFQTSEKLLGFPEGLSVDWLYGHLYIVVRTTIDNTTSLKNWQIWRCDLMGNDITLITGELPHFPRNLKVDPYNGFLWWIFKEKDSELYRYPLTKEMDSEAYRYSFMNGKRPKYNLKSKKVFQGLSLRGLVLDYPNFRLFVTSQKNNTILEVSLDGMSMSDFRSNTQQPFFNSVNSLAYLNGKFFWTNSIEVFSEELNGDTFYHNSYTFFSAGSFDHLLAVHKLGQPVPVPLNPPINVQVLFSKDSANIMWEAPQTPALMGEAAWQEWNYEIYVKEGKKLIHRTGIYEDNFLLSGLSSNTIYNVKVRAYSKSGKGPWSNFFKGRTLASTYSETKLLWKTNDELVLTNFQGNNSTIINTRKNVGNDVTYMTFFMEMIFMSSLNGSFHFINSSDGNVTEIVEMRGTYSTSYDWATKRLFGIELQNKRIKWISIINNSCGHLSLLTSALELKIDSFRGLLYLRTRYQVLKSSLTGKNVTEIHNEDIFSERLVYGLALDSNKSELWWMVKTSNSENQLYRKEMTISDDLRIKCIYKSIKEGSLLFINERLLWLTEDGEIILYDTVLESTAVMTPKNANVLLIAVQQKPPILFKDLKEVPFIPESIESSSVQIVGDWKDFIITWNHVQSLPLSEINSHVSRKLPDNFHGDLQYHVTIIGEEGKKTQFLTKENEVKVPWHVKPYSPLTVLVKGVTNWAEGEKTVVTLRSPTSIPSVPVNIRAFINEREKEESLFIRWDPPEIPNGIIEKYVVDICISNSKECTTYNTNETELAVNQLATSTIGTEGRLLEDVIFKVKGATSAGEGLDNVLRLSSFSDLKSFPEILLGNSSFLGIYDADKKTLRKVLPTHLFHSSFRSVAYSAEKEHIFWMDDHFDVFCSFIKDEEDKLSRITRLKGDGKFLSYDWINDSLFWFEQSANGTYLIKKFVIPYNMEEVVNISFSRKLIPKGLIASPFTNSLYILEERTGTLSLLKLQFNNSYMFDLFDNHIRNYKNCSCPRNPSLALGFAEDSSDPLSTFLYITLTKDTFEGHSASDILSVDPFGCQCNTVIHLADYGHEWCDILNVDRFYVYCYEISSKSLIWFHKSGVRSEEDFFETRLQVHPFFILPTSKFTQPLPEVKCLVVLEHSQYSTLVRSDEKSLTLNFGDPPPPQEGCPLSSIPTFNYVVYYSPVENDRSISCAKNVSHCYILESKNKTLTVEKLLAFTKYVFRLGYKTLYNKKFNISIYPGTATFFKTKAKVPNGVTQLTVVPLSPDEVKLSFEAPLNIHLEVHWKSVILGREFLKPSSVEGGKQRSIILDNLRPNTFYQFWVRIFSNEDQELFTDSPKVSTRTLPEPSKLTLIEKRSKSLRLHWVSSSDGNIIKHGVEFQLDGEFYWNATKMQESHPAIPYYYYFDDLRPASLYNFKLLLIYNYNKFKTYRWPKQGFYQFETNGDVPSHPGAVWLQQIDHGPSGLVWKTYWNKADSNGSPIFSYELQVGLKISGSDQINNLSYTTIYNGTENYWFVNLSDFDVNSKYIFRVRGWNEYGAGKWSSENLVMPLVSFSQYDSVHLPTILGATIPSFIMFSIILLSCLTISIRRADKKRRKAKNISLEIRSVSLDREMELSSLANLNNNFVSEENVLYSLQSFSGEELDLPRISRHCIGLTKFLGSGAFGEVFEGTATDLPGWPQVTKIAVKTLRKGATEMEKCEFVKEAQLMSQFQHDHILRLLAVCTDHDPFFLILELMEGGDLLSYLRANRGTEIALTHLDLIHMGVDVAKGCVYLEEMHFVHRDLAARNCLVSSKNPSQRIVKIGDFGLARDIYKNDYYRKEGEGLLPVRWMSPESLIDGVFTTHSDVWAFGVLLWEILTLGQQPYPARTNLEVLHYVRSGGSPTKPPSSPEEMYNLMKKCWNYSPENRPTFKECLSLILSVEEATSSLPVLTVHNVNYLSTNESMLPSKTSWNNLEDTNTASGASTMPLNVPLKVQQQYLHLVSDRELPSISTPSASILDCDMYEKPITLLESGLENTDQGERSLNTNQSKYFSEESCQNTFNSLEGSNSSYVLKTPQVVKNQSDENHIVLTLNPFYCSSTLKNETVLPLTTSNKSYTSNLIYSKMKKSYDTSCPTCEFQSPQFNSTYKAQKYTKKYSHEGMDISHSLIFPSLTSKNTNCSQFSKSIKGIIFDKNVLNKNGRKLIDRLCASQEDIASLKRTESQEPIRFFSDFSLNTMTSNQGCFSSTFLE